jgi:hypothetical protein
MAARMNRRLFLRGLGGAVVAAPFLASLGDRRARGQTASKPRQLIVMFTHYGHVTTKFFPAKSHGRLVADDLAHSLAPLAPYVGKLLIPRGIRAMNEWTKDNTGPGHGLGQGNDFHLNAVASLLTLQPITPNTNDPYTFDTGPKFNAAPIGSSLDHIIAQQLSPNGTPLFMRVGNRSDSNTSAISYLKAAGTAPDAAARAYPGLGTPMQVFSVLTNLLNMGQPMSPDSYALIRQKKVTDIVKDDLATLERMDMSADDKNKIAIWKALINDMGGMASAMCNQSLATRIGGRSDNVGMMPSNITLPVTADLDGADMYSVMAVLATACNYNPTIVLKYPANYVYSGIGVTSDADNLAHRVGNASSSGTCVPHVLEDLRAIDTYHAQKFAKLIGMLDGIQNGDGSTLLDNSAAVWLTDASDGCAHNLNNLPIIHAGSCGGYFKMGWTINVENGAADLTQGNSEAGCGPGGSGSVDGLTKETGTDPSIANAPINKYYCALMNALGVKADATGFPTKGGNAEVSRFGYSDRTTDFCGGYGAVAGAGIHDPGAFTALKAV